MTASRAIWNRNNRRESRDKNKNPAAGATSALSNIDRIARDLPPQKPVRKPTAGATNAWSRDQIQRARRTSLAPLLEKRGYRLRKKPGGNYLVEDEGDLVVKEFYWIWESRELKGNAIDFLMLVECRSFGQAMEILTADD